MGKVWRVANRHFIQFLFISYSNSNFSFGIILISAASFRKYILSEFHEDWMFGDFEVEGKAANNNRGWIVFATDNPDQLNLCKWSCIECPVGNQIVNCIFHLPGHCPRSFELSRVFNGRTHYDLSYKLELLSPIQLHSQVWMNEVWYVILISFDGPTWKLLCKPCRIHSCLFI